MDFAIVSGKSVAMNGSEDDRDEVESLRKKINGDFIWFIHNGESYIIRDAATVSALTPDGGWIDVDIRRDAAVDPIGAGDAFNAGYIAVRLRGGSVQEAIRAGAYCGAAVTSALSDTAAFPRSLR